MGLSIGRSIERCNGCIIPVPNDAAGVTVQFELHAEASGNGQVA
jgi:hypothetical protein